MLLFSLKSWNYSVGIPGLVDELAGGKVGDKQYRGEDQ